ncbi:hypothetical protein JXA48_05190 [Candidatus Woesearchaeota archaeon]|nr:hypothetical protein [Candidatus Woesearchaeota archaeon]
MLRSERRSFFCPNTLWAELERETKDDISISTYIRLAIVEKLISDHPDREEYFKDLISGRFPRN